jgi:hypothetical protein
MLCPYNGSDDDQVPFAARDFVKIHNILSYMVFL